MQKNTNVRCYIQSECIAFLKTKEAFGGLSNMASGYPLCVNQIPIRSSEALYQACRFPHMPEVQHLIIKQTSPMTAKMVSKPYRSQSREDWMRVRVKVMRWSLRVKLAQNLQSFSQLLLETGDLPIVEKSFKDSYWGAKPTNDGALVGMNVLGRLLMELREELKSGQFGKAEFLEPLAIPNFLLDGRPVESITIKQELSPIVRQHSLFEMTPDIPRNTGSMNEKLTLQAYPQYKSSGVEWLGEVPSEWEIFRGKRVFTQRTERAQPNDVQLSATQAYGVIPQEEYESKIGRKVTKIQFHLEKRKHVELDDFVISMRSFQGGLERAYASGCIRSSYVVLRPLLKIHPGYYTYLFKSQRYIEALQATASFIRDGQDLNFDNFSKVDLALPPYGQQTAIANFLDKKTTQIDEAITIKEQQIVLLKERKQIIIQKAVTQGLDSNVLMKDSGVDWIGDIPKHWLYEPIKHSLTGVIDCEHKTAPFVDEEEHFVVRTSNVKNGKLTMEGAKYTSEKGYKKWTKRGVPKPGDVLLTREAPAGEACLVPDNLKLCLGQRMVWLKVDRQRILPEFAIALIYSSVGRTYIDFLSAGSTVLHFNMADINNIPVLLPPLVEQKELVEHINYESDKIGTAIMGQLQQIDKLKEYKTTLINSAVTGKIKVTDL